MTPFQFGYNIGQLEKQAINPGAIVGRLANAASGIGRGAQTINRGSQHIVKGFGHALQGAGEIVGTKARPTFSPKGGTSLGNSTGLGALLLGTGRGMQTAGKSLIDNIGSGGTRATRDLRGVLGHGMRLTGSAIRGGGHAVNMAGEGLQAVGRGVRAVGDAPAGLPTLAAAGLLGGAATVAPKLPLPGVKFQSPLDINFSYKTQKPVELEW
jgi:hypothetical protein